MVRLSFLILISITSGCIKNKNEKIIYTSDHFIKQTFYSNGKLRTQASFSLDSLRDGYASKYFSNGNIEIEVPYINNLKNGVAKEYYENGNIRASYRYANDHIEGHALWLYNSSDTFVKAMYLHGKRTGIEQEYYSKNRLHKWKWRDTSSELIIFQIQFDTLGNFFSTKGEPYIKAAKLKRSDSILITIVPLQSLKINQHTYITFKKDSLTIDKKKHTLFSNDTINWIKFRDSKKDKFRCFCEMVLVDSLGKDLAEFSTEIVN